MLQPANRVVEKEAVPPEVMARKLRSGRMLDFSPCTELAVAAIVFAALHAWTIVVMFLAYAVACFPTALSQHRNNTKRLEDVIFRYEEWYQQQGDLHKN